MNVDNLPYKPGDCRLLSDRTQLAVASPYHGRNRTHLHLLIPSVCRISFGWPLTAYHQGTSRPPDDDMPCYRTLIADVTPLGLACKSYVPL
jgi:hypothetical protein